MKIEEAVEWRAPVWAPAVQSAFTRSKLPTGSQVLEIGYYSGAMSCFMAKNRGWNITAYDIESRLVQPAQSMAKTYGVEGKITFQTIDPKKTLEIKGQFDGIFLKSVLYHIKDWDQYRNWLNWIYSNLKPGGVLMAVENGKGHLLDQLVRKRLAWGDNILFEQKVLNLFKEVFPNLSIEYFGGMSQYATFSPWLSKTLQKVEEGLNIPGPNNCFIASIVATKPREEN